MQIGEKLKQLRLRTNLTQEELAIRCDLSKGFISQLERDQSSPSIATLVDILECLGTTPAEFFTQTTPEVVRHKQDDAYSSEDEELGHTITWIIPSAQKNEMEPILISLRPGGKTQTYDPHAGEVFGYVLTGAATLHRGGKKWKVKKGDSIYYTATLPYFIENHTSQNMSLLWVSTPPSF